MKRLIWIRERIPGPRDLLRITRVYLFGPRVVTFSDRLPLVIMVVGLVFSVGYTYHRLIEAIDARSRVGCASFAAQADQSQSIRDLLSIANSRQLSPVDRALVDRAQQRSGRAHDVQVALQRQLRCPAPPPEGHP